MTFTEDEFLEWKEHDVTKAFFAKVFAKREQIKEDLIHQLYENPEFACGKAMLAEELLAMDYETFSEKTQ